MSFLAAGLLGVSALAAQSPASQPAPTTAKPATHHPARHKAHPAPAPVVPVPPPVVPVAPPPPDWPVNDHPAPPGVTWNQTTLQIDAPNSSLRQILEAVAKATGATVEGLGADQRIFGVYGPGNARDVLAQLLLGSGYNFILIGDNGQGLPRQIVLSSAHSNNAADSTNRAANNPAGRRAAADADDNDDDVVDNQVDPTPPPPPPVRPAFGQEGAPRTPQQIMQEQQQQNQLPGAPANQPNNQPPN